MAKRAYRWTWTARIEQETLTALQELAGSLHFTVTTPSRWLGDPSAPDMLDALAAAYRRDPDAVRLAFKVLGVLPPAADPGEPAP